MVRGRGRKITWTLASLESRKEIFDYWNKRNKSSIFSKKLRNLFNEHLLIVADYPLSSEKITKPDIRKRLVRDFYILYNITDTEIIVLDVWDTRQNPKEFPIK